MSNLKLRIISAVILAVKVLLLAWAGGVFFRGLAALIGAAILFEWLTICAGRRGEGRSRLVDWTAALLFVFFLLVLVWGAPAETILLVAAAAFAVTSLAALLLRDGWWTPAGLAYAALSALALAAIRGDDHAGLIGLLFLFAVVWATDILAYFVGRRIGGPKLAPAISPGKTRSGAVGGLIGGIVAGLAVAIAAGLPNLGVLALVAAILSVVSQAGDLFESWIKRRHGVKDSGWIIPGHGGVMDRVDGLVAAAVALYLIGAATGDAARPSAILFGG